VTIEFLFWEGCPSHPEARALLRFAVSDAYDDLAAAMEA